jgi:hypothetical protein
MAQAAVKAVEQDGEETGSSTEERYPGAGLNGRAGPERSQRHICGRDDPHLMLAFSAMLKRVKNLIMDSSFGLPKQGHRVRLES